MPDSSDDDDRRPTRISVCRRPPPPVRPYTTTVIDYSYTVQITGRLQHSQDLERTVPAHVSEAIVHAVSELICYRPHRAGDWRRPTCVQHISAGPHDTYVDQDCQILLERDACARYNGQVAVIHTEACKNHDIDATVWQCLRKDEHVAEDVQEYLDKRYETPDGVPIWFRDIATREISLGEASAAGLYLSDVTFGPVIENDGSRDGGYNGGGGGGDGSGGNGGSGRGDGGGDGPYFTGITDEEDAVQKDGLTAGGKVVASMMGILFFLLLLLCCCCAARRRRRSVGDEDELNKLNNKVLDDDVEGWGNGGGRGGNGGDGDDAATVQDDDDDGSYRSANFMQPGLHHSKLDVHQCQSVLCEACNPAASSADVISFISSGPRNPSARSGAAQLKRVGSKHVRKAKAAAQEAELQRVARIHAARTADTSAPPPPPPLELEDGAVGPPPQAADDPPCDHSNAEPNEPDGASTGASTAKYQCPCCTG